MIKHVLRTATYVSISLGITQLLFLVFDFGVGGLKNVGLLILALFILFFALHPILNLLSFANHGMGLIVINLCLTFIVLLVASSFLPSLKITEINPSNLIIIGVMLPSTKLSTLWSTLVASLSITIFYRYLSWLAKKKR